MSAVGSWDLVRPARYGTRVPVLKTVLLGGRRTSNATGRSARQRGKIGAPASCPGPDRAAEIRSTPCAQGLPRSPRNTGFSASAIRGFVRPETFGAVSTGRTGTTGTITAVAGLPALQRGEPGQGRKAAATAVPCKCRGSGSPPQQRCEGRLANEAPFVVSMSGFRGARFATPRFPMPKFRC